MERTHTTQPTSDREQREALERLQGEVAQTRRAAAAARETRAAALEAARAALPLAEASHAAAEARCAALEQELSATKRRLAGLRERLVAKQKEDAVLARGAALRDVVFVPTPEEPFLSYRALERDDAGRVIDVAPPPRRRRKELDWPSVLLLGVPFFMLLYELFK